MRVRLDGIKSYVDAIADTGVCENITPPDKKPRGKMSFQSTESGVGERLLLQDCKATARVKGVPFSQPPVASGRACPRSSPCLFGRSLRGSDQGAAEEGAQRAAADEAWATVFRASCEGDEVPASSDLPGALSGLRGPCSVAYPMKFKSG